ncbi:MAG TPA: hypothetical protein VK461_14840 [Acidimicrobiales bacterium]|nr:hypothetical protein [Acidimicrobiales bacterium]
MATQLSILTAVLDGQEDALRSTIEAIPLREASPFASVPGTHNGRWVVVRPRPLDPDTFLMCSATVDSPVDVWLDGFLRVLGPTADAIWSQCAGWPGGGGASRKAAWLASHRVHTALSFATWDARAETILEALATRDRIARFTVRVQGLEATALLAAYREEFSR